MINCFFNNLKGSRIRLLKHYGKAILITVSFGLVISYYGCFDQEAYNKKILPDRIDRFALDYIELIKSGDIEEANKRISDSKIAKLERDDLLAISNKFALEKIEAVKPVDATYYKYDDYIEYYVKYKIYYKNQIQLALLGVIDKKEILGIIKMEIGEPSVLSKGTSSETKIKRIVFSLMSFGYLAVIFIGIIQCLRSTMIVKWKLFFSFICLVGAIKFLFNFNSGEFAVQIMSVGMTAPVYRILGFSGEPSIILSFYIPVGAIIFLAKRKLIVKKLEEVPGRS